MRVPQAEYDRALALQFGAVADADNLQLAGPALGHTFNGVVDQSAGQAMKSGLRVIVADRHQMAVLLLHTDARGQLRVQFALGALHGDRAPFDLDRNSLRERNRFSSNS